MTIKRFLANETIFQNYIDLPLEFLDDPRHKDISALREQSNKYLEELGFFRELEIKLKGKTVYINKIKIKFSPSEFLVFKLLFENTNSTVGYEDIAKQLWDEDFLEKFSLNTISKCVNRMKQKLYDNGIRNTFITTVRGEGYSLKS
jgi:DNA-binding response OmpR family regulator